MSNWAQQGALVLGIDEVDGLLDAIGGDGLGRDVHADGLDQNLRHELGDIGRHGGGEQQRLALPRNERHDPAHVAQEAHVEHAVGFVDDERAHHVEADVLLIDEIEQASRRGDEDVDAVAERRNLLVLIDAAEDDGIAELEIAAVGLEAVVYLERELARGRQDERAHAARFVLTGVLGEALEQRQAERGGLAGAGLRDAEDVAARKHQRNGLGLDRGGIDIVFGGKSALKRLGHAERGKHRNRQNKSLLARKGAALRTRVLALLPPSTHIWSERRVDLWFVMTLRQGGACRAITSDVDRISILLNEMSRSEGRNAAVPPL